MRPSRLSFTILFQAAILTLGVSASAFAQQPAPKEDPQALVTEARQLTQDGQLAQAEATLSRALTVDPNSSEAHTRLGIVLDLVGKYPQAREHLAKGLELAKKDQQNLALSATAVSYVFDGKVAESAKYYQRIFDQQMAEQELDDAAGTANALGRVYIEHGDLKHARQWYQTGNETARKISKLSSDQIDLWEMRWHHALSRLAARAKDQATADKEAAALKTLVDKNDENRKQMPIYHYLVGYNAFHLGDMDAALAALRQANQDDIFIVALLAQAYEKKGDRASAQPLYEKAAKSSTHNLNTAFVKALAERKVKDGASK